MVCDCWINVTTARLTLRPDAGIALPTTRGARLVATCSELPLRSTLSWIVVMSGLYWKIIGILFGVRLDGAEGLIGESLPILKGG